VNAAALGMALRRRRRAEDGRTNGDGGRAGTRRPVSRARTRPADRGAASSCRGAWSARLAALNLLDSIRLAGRRSSKAATRGRRAPAARRLVLVGGRCRRTTARYGSAERRRRRNCGQPTRAERGDDGPALESVGACYRNVSGGLRNARAGVSRGGNCRGPRTDFLLGRSKTLDGLVRGHFKTGIVLAPETARMLAPLVLRGERDPRLAPFGVERLRPSSALPSADS
jgi:hypothetical protein